jgi:predicted O-methyltransferase YrrM
MSRYTLINDIIKNVQNGIFVEIGTDNGILAEFILANSTNSILYCVDPYVCYNDYDDAINNVTGNNLYETTYNKLKTKFGNRVIFVRKFSEEASNDIPNDIDFLYIDGNHRYTYVYKDLELYYPKVKKNGYVVGDDAVDTDDLKRNENGDVFIQWNQYSYGNYGVIKAFNQFFQNKKINGEIIYNQYVIKKS